MLFTEWKYHSEFIWLNEIVAQWIPDTDKIEIENMHILTIRHARKHT